MSVGLSDVRPNSRLSFTPPIQPNNKLRPEMSPTPNSNDEEGGFAKSLAKKLFASPESPFTAFADRQRAERLEQCRQLEVILKSCQSATVERDIRSRGEGAGDMHLDATGLTSEDGTLTTTKSGIKIARFFNWNSPHSSTEDSEAESERNVFREAAASFSGDGQVDAVRNNGNNTKRRNNHNFSHGCAKETHELWACRALSLGCGNYVGDLRRCWKENSSDKPQNQTDSFEGSEISYEGRDSCRKIQQDMARCVTRNARELTERMEARSKEGK